MKHQILVIVKGGMIQTVYATSKDVEISICDHDLPEDSSKLIYYKAEADFIITPEVLEDSLRAIIDGEELPKQNIPLNGEYIVMETFGGATHTTICTDEEGENKVFDNLADAEAEAADCQDGIVVPL